MDAWRAHSRQRSKGQKGNQLVKHSAFKGSVSLVVQALLNSIERSRPIATHVSDTDLNERGKMNNLYFLPVHCR